ncbi:MAG: AMP-binding protein [Spirochaetes bacterium]|jgi:phenylacetate-CoA ligase|nr:AMP-binding protein [Spirochaetota bacterium]
MDINGRYWNEKVETMSAEELFRLESEKLVKEVGYVYRNSPFYRAKFKEIGLEPGEIKTRDDIVKLPFTSKDDLRQTQAEEGGLGGHQCAPKSDLVRIQGTSGTTGRPLYIGLTRHDADVWKELFARHAWTGGLRPGDSFVHPANYTLFVGGLSEAVSAEAMGVCVIPAPLATTGLEKLMQIVMTMKPTVLFATPSSTVFLADYVRKQLGIEPVSLGFMKGFMAGEAMPEEDRRKIEEEWGIVARNFYGLADVAADLASECGEGEGMHFCGQGLIQAELIDPATLKSVPMVDGAEGEIVYTTIDREATPVLRYRCRDMVRVFTSRCACGRTSFRFSVFGRSDDMLKVKAVNVFPSAVKDVISSFMPETTGEFRIVLYEPGPAISTNLELKIEHGEGVSGDKINDLAARLKRSIKEKLVFTPEIKMIPPNTLERSEYKINYFERMYEKK